MRRGRNAVAEPAVFAGNRDNTSAGASSTGVTTNASPRKTSSAIALWLCAHVSAGLVRTLGRHRGCALLHAGRDQTDFGLLPRLPKFLGSLRQLPRVPSRLAARGRGGELERVAT